MSHYTTNVSPLPNRRGVIQSVVYGSAMFDPHTVASLRAESHPFHLAHDDADSIRFARCIGLFAFTEDSAIEAQA